MSTVYYAGQFMPESQAKIPLSDRGFQIGDGAFATIQVKEGIPLFLETHLEQLKKQCKAFNLIMPQVERETIEELIKLNGAQEEIWRLKIIVTGGDDVENRLPERKGRVVIFLKPFTPLPFKPLKMGVFPIPYHTCHASFKSLSHLNRFYVMEDAYQRGLDDCVTTTERGYILEAAFGNLFWVVEKTLFTPDPALPIYFGVTVRNAIKLAKEVGFEIEYARLTLSQLPQEAAAFRTNTMQGIRPIAQIGERTFAPNPVVQTLFLNGYAHMLQQEQTVESAPGVR